MERSSFFLCKKSFFHPPPAISPWHRKNLRRSLSHKLYNICHCCLAHCNFLSLADFRSPQSHHGSKDPPCCYPFFCRYSASCSGCAYPYSWIWVCSCPNTRSTNPCVHVRRSVWQTTLPYVAPTYAWNQCHWTWWVLALFMDSIKKYALDNNKGN